MQFNLKFMREFFKFFRNSERDAMVDSDDKMSLSEVGEIDVLTPEGLHKFPLAITDSKREGQNTAWMIKTVEEKILVVFHIDYFIKQVYSHNMNGLYAIVAHEIGHFLSGHFTRQADKDLDVKPEVQKFFAARYLENPSEANEITYMRSVFFALLKGGVITCELEADMMALKFVPVADLIHIHSQDFDDKVNPFTVVEKVNRIKRLNQYVDNNDIDQKGYNLFIQLRDINKKEET